MIRRIVTTHSNVGKAAFASDGPPARIVEFKHVPGMSAALLWETRASTEVGGAVEDPTPQAASWVPSTGGTNLMVVVFPPDSVMVSSEFDPAAAGGEYMEKLPGLAEKFEIDAPGMHRTDTVDYGIVLDGEIDIELDDGQIRKVGTHDIVVQNGTRHAWRNPSTKPATVLFVLVGAKRR